MKKWDKIWARMSVILVVFVGIFLPIIGHAATDSYPTLTGRVVDEAHILSPSERTALENRLAQAEPHQVVAVSLASLRGQEIEEYGVALGRHWGIGRKDENDGVLIMIAPTERQMRIEVGYGLEGTLTDARADQIIRHIMLPLAKQGKYGEALIQGSNAVIGVLTATAVPATPETQTDSEQAIIRPFTYTYIFSFFLKVVFSILGGLGLVIFMILLVSHLENRRTKKKKSTPEYIPEKEIKKIIANCKVPTTKQEKELSRQDRLCFFRKILLLNLIFFPPLILFIVLICVNDTINRMILGVCGFVFFYACYTSTKAMLKIYRKNPYFPFQEYKKEVKKLKKRGSGFSDSDSGSSGGGSFGGGSFGGGSSFSGGGGSFGGGGSSGRW